MDTSREERHELDSPVWAVVTHNKVQDGMTYFEAIKAIDLLGEKFASEATITTASAANRQQNNSDR